MKFILCHEKVSGIKVLVNLEKILSICKNEDGTAFIETHIDIDENGVGFDTQELFEEIVLQIKK